MDCIQSKQVLADINRVACSFFLFVFHAISAFLKKQVNIAHTKRNRTPFWRPVPFDKP